MDVRHQLRSPTSGRDGMQTYVTSTTGLVKNDPSSRARMPGRRKVPALFIFLTPFFSPNVITVTKLYATADPQVMKKLFSLPIQLNPYCSGNTLDWCLILSYPLI